MNYSGKIDLKKFKNAFFTNIKGKTATKQCLCIPVEDNFLFVGEKGIYFDFVCREIQEDKRQYDNTHVIVQNFPKQVFEQMTDEQKKTQPIFGQLKEPPSTAMQATTETEVEEANDLPF